MVNSLKENQIFVFGSNKRGFHLGGAARQAKENFGAVEGQGEGIQGQSYAFPTLDEHLKQVTLYQLEDSRRKLYSYADENPDKEFLLTKVGTGIAGFSDEAIEDLFKELPSNVTKIWS